MVSLLGLWVPGSVPHQYAYDFFAYSHLHKIRIKMNSQNIEILLTLQRWLLHCRQNGRLVRWVLRLLVNDPQGISCTLNKSKGVICIQTFKNQALLSVIRPTDNQSAPIKATHTSTESLNGRLYSTKDVAPHVKWNIFLSWFLCYHNLTWSFHPSIMTDLMYLTIGIISVVEIMTDFKGIDISLHRSGGGIVLDGGS
jgi:hypothetical protein